MGDDSTSLSFLNLNWCDKVDTSLIYPIILDPLYTDLYLEISYKLQDLLQKIKQVNFSYKIINEEFIRIKDFKTKQIILEMGVCDFEKLEFINLHQLKIYIILNKKKYKRKISSMINKTYKENVINSAHKPIENNYESIKKLMFELQIKKNVNVIFVENEIDLFRELKDILKHLVSDKKFVPKVKTFKIGKEQEYLTFILSKIPGISSCVAKNIADRYGTLANLSLLVKNNRTEELSEMIIEDKENHKCRMLGTVQAKQILRIFTSDDPAEKLL
ncbi:hypothetical protein NCER_101571 [Vairimorpha ceranae BRL01]|uniref:Uncharacterized protein n=2 Tax=Vairimorpha ceranae TaxID=40302 RepID=C4VAB6_VAIC1|nr:bos1-like vesicular transport protein [Vairimorpha ceranae]EEQ81832.1 hypothetical protein NCER_101571 [Vairimorpha ceranae BRL01]KAF5140546.1 hypothetical protein G9O61_00g013510 [Vairimorpha ceranae]KKO75224.1 bos1-like vesicular transport protein [Vairimorpha ceranae]